MAWIKAQNENLFDVTSIHVQDRHSCEVRGRTHSYEGTFCLGTYNGPEVAKTVKNDIEEWLICGGKGVLSMPDNDSLCTPKKNCGTCMYRNHAPIHACLTCGHDGVAYSNWGPKTSKTVPDVKLPCKFFGGPLDGTTMCVSNASKNVSIPAVADGGLGSWEYERIGARTDFILKAFPAHDASKPLFDTNLGDKIEVTRDGETLTCKVIKIVRKGSHGVFKMELTKE